VAKNSELKQKPQSRRLTDLRLFAPPRLVEKNNDKRRSQKG